jgi:hypothetical protein
VKATPDSAAKKLLFVIEKPSVVVPLIVIVPAPNALVMVGGVRTVIDATAELPLPASLDVTGLVTLVYWAAEDAVTLREKVQEVFADRDAPERLTWPEPATAVIVPPPQPPVRPLGVVTVMLAGNVSEKPTAVSVVELSLFATVKVREVVASTGMVAAPKLLMTTGGVTARAVPVPAATNRAATSAGIAMRMGQPLS